MENVEHKETYKKWKTLVNMSKGELEKFYNSQEGKDAGLSSKEASEQGISSGRESARWIMKMKDTPVSDWTPSMWRWAKKQISFISRMSGNKGPLYDDKGNKTRKHTSLLIWGNNPDIRYKDGGLIKTYRNKFNIKYGFDNNESHSLAEISKIVNLKLSSLQDIYNKGIGAYKTNPQSVRPNVKSKEQWAMARVYSAVMGGKAAGVDANELERGRKYVEGGRASNLTPAQQKLVRTPEFKAWFGDWENSPETASKVVDENGEPLVVYHGTLQKFNVFNTYFDNGTYHGKGAYFTSSLKDLKTNYVTNKEDIYLECFLNLTNPLIVGKKSESTYFERKDREIILQQLRYYKFPRVNYAYEKSYDSDILEKIVREEFRESKSGELLNSIYRELGFSGIIFLSPNKLKGHTAPLKTKHFVAFNSNQIKLADGSNTTFDGSNPDIRFADGGSLNSFQQLAKRYNNG